jgi:cold shock protein
VIGLTEGIVDKYSEDKGFGYIIQNNGKKIFVERSSIDIPGYKTLVPGERITFELKETIRGHEAMKVRKV